MILIHPHDQHLLRNDYFYVDRILLSSLCSAPYILSVAADGLQWILTQYSITHIRQYLHDFIFAPWVRLPQFQLSTPGSFLEQSKLVYLSTCLTFLGIQVNTKALLLCLSQEKLGQLKQELCYCILQKTITKRELQSLTGLLQFATKVIRPGRTTICNAIYRITPWSPHSSKFYSQGRHHMMVRTYLQNNETVFSYSEIATPCSLISIFIQMYLVPGVVEVTRVYVGFNLNSLIIFVPSQLLLKNLYQQWWQCQYLAISGRITWFNSQQTIWLLSTSSTQHTAKTHTSCTQSTSSCSQQLTLTSGLQLSMWRVMQTPQQMTYHVITNLSRDNLPLFFSCVPQAEYNKPPQVSPSFLNLLGYDHHIWTSIDWIRLFSNSIQQF